MNPTEEGLRRLENDEWNRVAVIGKCKSCDERRMVKNLTDPFIVENMSESEFVVCLCFKCFEKQCLIQDHVNNKRIHRTSDSFGIIKENCKNDR